jgi:hypothetical protein
MTFTQNTLGIVKLRLSLIWNIFVHQTLTAMTKLHSITCSKDYDSKVDEIGNERSDESDIDWFHLQGSLVS